MWWPYHSKNHAGQPWTPIYAELSDVEDVLQPLARERTTRWRRWCYFRMSELRHEKLTTKTLYCWTSSLLGTRQSLVASPPWAFPTAERIRQRCSSRCIGRRAHRLLFFNSFSPWPSLSPSTWWHERRRVVAGLKEVPSVPLRSPESPYPWRLIRLVPRLSVLPWKTWSINRDSPPSQITWGPKILTAQCHPHPRTILRRDKTFPQRHCRSRWEITLLGWL